MTTLPPDAAEMMALARRLTAASGRARPIGLTALAGGKNNRVFRVDLDAGPPVVLKSYFADSRDPRDRRTAEWRFLTEAWSAGVRNVPQPLATEPQSHAGLYSFVAGHKLAPGTVTGAHVDAALDFVATVNARGREMASFAPASEACFSLAEHVATIEKRVERLADLDPEAPLRDQAAAFLASELRPVWAAVRARIATEGSQAGEEIADREQCLSPSDFGFHNALVDGTGRVAFIDFEYAGRDDPAKLVSDFFCQPEIPVPVAHHGRFVAALAERLSLGPGFLDRARLLLDAYRVKWTCIILNEFLAVGAARRAFADSGERERRCAAQLDKARRCLAPVEVR